METSSNLHCWDVYFMGFQDTMPKIEKGACP